jgi:hypothetical protein
LAFLRGGIPFRRFHVPLWVRQIPIPPQRNCTTILRRRSWVLIRISRHYISNIFFLILVGDIVILLASVALTYWKVDWVGEGVFWPKVVVLAATTLLLFYLSTAHHEQRCKWA